MRIWRRWNRWATLGCSFTSQAMAALPAAPSSLTVSNPTSSTLDLIWTDNASDETGFKVERSADGATGWTQIGTNTANDTTYIDSGLTAETTYYYRVRAYNSNGDSTYSNTANGTTAVGFTGDMDGISSVETAYSLRRLFTAYEGSAVRIQRSSDSTEQDIGFTSDGSFDESAFSSFVGGGTGYVAKWYDQSGNSRDAVQSTQASMPVIALSVVNNRPVVRFDGTADRLLTASFTAVSQPFTWIHVAKQDNTSNLVPISNNAGANVFWYTGALSFSAGSGVTKAAGADSWHIASAIANGASSSVYGEGGTASTGNAGTNGFAQVEIGAYTGAFFWDGDIVEFISLSAAISASDHNTIGNSMGNYYGITWNTIA